ncbi:hypothetical protein MJO29_014883 [Puccinia striiformis f. sp. tritici]|nr:hypothetical protein MJO29_014883 [Puccinia striiformis f. sp. tritici]
MKFPFLEGTVEFITGKGTRNYEKKQLVGSSEAEEEGNGLQEAKDELRSLFLLIGIETTQIVKKLVKMMMECLKETTKKKGKPKKEIENRIEAAELLIETKFHFHLNCCALVDENNVDQSNEKVRE